MVDEAEQVPLERGEPALADAHRRRSEDGSPDHDADDVARMAMDAGIARRPGRRTGLAARSVARWSGIRRRDGGHEARTQIRCSAAAASRANAVAASSPRQASADAVTASPSE